MSTIAGYFDETILNNIRRKATEIMFDDRIKQQFIPNYAVINALKSVETATVLPSIARTQKDVDVDIIWQQVCGLSVEDNVTCEIGGTKSSTNKETKSLSYLKVVNFSADEADFIDNEFDVEESIAKLFLKADVEHTEAFAQYCVGQLNNFRGWNVVTNGKGTVSGAETYIEAPYWNSALAAYFSRVAIGNKFTSPITLSGENLYEQMYVADAHRADADGKGDAILFGNMRMYFDLFNIDGVNDPDLKTYMLSQGSVAFGNRAFNPERIQVLHDRSRYKIMSRFLPGMWYDVYYDTECTTNDLMQHNFKVKLTADLFNNPTGCDDNNTGVLSFTCGSAS